MAQDRTRRRSHHREVNEFVGVREGKRALHVLDQVQTQTIDHRQAKELVDQVPAVELPAAIAFLEFLRERGAAALGRVRSVPVKRTAA